MAYDLLIKGGLVVDGSGQPGFRADVAVKDGKVAEVGRIGASADRVIDADGLVVAPGFIDHHTHLDAQLFWDPAGTSEPQHGVTSVIAGNCGLTLAPLAPGGEDALVKSLVRVEAIPRSVLEEGVPWGWHTYGEYLDAFEDRVAINVGGHVGHIAIRHAVMGEEAVERKATPDEIRRMQRLVGESMEGGALGLSTNRNHRHTREDGKPVASRLADDEELFALCDVLGDLNAGVVQTIMGLQSVEQIGWYEQIARRTQRPVTWQSIRHLWVEPDLWRQQLDGLERVAAAGYRVYGMSSSLPIAGRWDLQDTQRFDEFPVWKNVLFLPLPVRKQALSDPDTRERLRADLAVPRKTAYHRRWDLLYVNKVMKPENAGYVGKSVAEVAASRGQDPLDAFLDLSLEEDLKTVFWTTNGGGDPEAARVLFNSPHVLVGISDAGAHVQFEAAFGYSTTLLGLWVRERGAITLEQAIYKLTFHVASIYGLAGRGLLRPGYAADIAVFDPATVNAGEPEWAHDYPGGTRRYVQPSEGIHQTIVNGRVIYEDGGLTGDQPGQVMRGAAYARTAVAA